MDRKAVLWSEEERARGARPLLVMLHGWSYDETHLHRLITPRLPEEVVVASVRARIPEAGGFAWFPSAGNPIGDPRPHVVNAAALDVLSWLETIEAPSIGLLGFSQGGAMAHQLMRWAPQRFAYCVNLAGFVLRDEQPGDDTLSVTRPPVFWGRGRDDGSSRRVRSCGPNRGSLTTPLPKSTSIRDSVMTSAAGRSTTSPRSSASRSASGFEEE